MYDAHFHSPDQPHHSRIHGLHLRMLVELPVLQAQPEDAGNPRGMAPEIGVSDELNRIHLWGNVQWACGRISIGALRIPTTDERDRIECCIKETLQPFLAELLLAQLEQAIREGQAIVN